MAYESWIEKMFKDEGRREACFYAAAHIFEDGLPFIKIMKYTKMSAAEVESFANGMFIGRVHAYCEILPAMFDDDVPMEKIIKYTNLSEEKIKEFMDGLNLDRAETNEKIEKFENYESSFNVTQKMLKKVMPDKGGK